MAASNSEAEFVSETQILMDKDMQSVSQMLRAAGEAARAEREEASEYRREVLELLRGSAKATCFSELRQAALVSPTTWNNHVFRV